ncbi:MAG TPA: hypothetical protein VKN37_10000 [Roseovarius sp.]|nr:hypothetical protein [Roseovarius sp.]
MFDRTEYLTPRQARCQQRAQAARGWARVVNLAMVGCCLGAIWQEPEIAPPVHAGMALVVGNVARLVLDPETQRAATEEGEAASGV